jgi:APA family basic amino acid/polyamine antiporter
MVGNAAGKLIAILALGILTVINCLGVRAGTTVQTTLTVLKMIAIAGLVGCGLILVKPASGAQIVTAPDASGFAALRQFGAAMVPVVFAYGGWQTAAFIGGEVKNPRRNLPLGLILGVLGVVILYLSVNWVCLRTLGSGGLAQTPTPAADVAQLALGERGSFFISAAIIISTLGFLSQGMLTAPRVYFAMADDGLFFRALARIHAETQVPVAAVALQGVTAVVIALSGRYEQILNYVTSVDFIFYGLTAASVFVFRRRDRLTWAAGQNRMSRTSKAMGRGEAENVGLGNFRVPGHPFTTLFFVASCWLVVLNLIFKYPKDSFVGLVMMLTGIPVYLYWQRQRRLTL